MNITYLIIIILGISFQNAMNKEFDKAIKTGGEYFFAMVTSLFAAVFFAITSGGFSFDAGIIPYCIGFGISYALTTVATFLAISIGSMSISSLVISYSLMIPTMYGIFFLGDPVGYGFVVGIILLVISLAIINKPTKDVPITAKWIVYLLLAFAGNGMCSVVQKMQQDAFGGSYKNEFMIIALVIVCVVLGIAVFMKERKNVGFYMKKGWRFGALCGIMNGVVNLFVMILSGKMNVSVMFPLISAGGLVITFIISKLRYKEKLSARQLAGFVIGIGSIVFLSI